MSSKFFIKPIGYFILNFTIKVCKLKNLYLKNFTSETYKQDNH